MKRTRKPRTSVLLSIRGLFDAREAGFDEAALDDEETALGDDDVLCELSLEEVAKTGKIAVRNGTRNHGHGMESPAPDGRSYAPNLDFYDRNLN